MEENERRLLETEFKTDDTFSELWFLEVIKLLRQIEANTRKA